MATFEEYLQNATFVQMNAHFIHVDHLLPYNGDPTSAVEFEQKTYPFKTYVFRFGDKAMTMRAADAEGKLYVKWMKFHDNLPNQALPVGGNVRIGVKQEGEER